MGVLGFFSIKITNAKSKFYGKTLSALGREITLNKLKGEKVCIDVSHMIYSGLLALKSVDTLTDEEGNPTSHINTILNKIIQLQEAGLTQIWVFDSPEINDMKKRALERREKRRSAAKEDKKLTEEDRGKRTFKMSGDHVNDIKQLLTSMGIMYVEAPKGIEAEQYGAFLSKESNGRYCKYVISADADVIMFGGNLLRIYHNRTTKKTVYQIFEMEEILTELDITYEQLVKIGVTLGSDFNDGTDGIGAATVVDKVKADSFYYTFSQKAAMEYFKSDISGKLGENDVVKEEYSRKKVLEYLSGKNFAKERIEKRLDTYEKYREKN
jgi:5'-3' exonuclease